MQTRVIVVENDDQVRAETVRCLQAAGFLAEGTNCGLGLDDLLLSPPVPDVVLLDLHVPGEDGVSISQRVRRVFPETGIVMLATRSLPSEKVSGYLAGADAFLTKPVAGEELCAVLASLLRRLRRQRPPAWLLDRMGGTIISPGGASARLTGPEALLLERFALARDGFLDNVDLLALFVDEKNAPEKGYVEVVLSRLRKKLTALHADADRRMIRAVRGKGYQLLIPIQIQGVRWRQGTSGGARQT